LRNWSTTGVSNTISHHFHHNTNTQHKNSCARNTSMDTLQKTTTTTTTTTTAASIVVETCCCGRCASQARGRGHCRRTVHTTSLVQRINSCCCCCCCCCCVVVVFCCCCCCCCGIGCDNITQSITTIIKRTQIDETELKFILPIQPISKQRSDRRCR
jgi:hypothetical protein